MVAHGLKLIVGGLKFLKFLDDPFVIVLLGGLAEFFKLCEQLRLVVFQGRFGRASQDGRGRTRS